MFTAIMVTRAMVKMIFGARDFKKLLISGAAMVSTITFMGVRNLAFGVTVLLTVLALFSWFHKGLNYGLDFTGGTLIELTYEKPADVTQVRSELVKAGYHEAIVQSFGATTDLLVRMPGEDPQLGHQVAEALQKVGGDNPASVKRVEFVGPQVGEELRDQGGLGMLMALGGIMIYLAFRFQWKFGVGAIVSLIHDVVVTVGILAYFQITFDLTVLAAVLAIIGYSLNDTIVVFDRVRENFRVLRKATLIENINISTTQTLLRTMATSISTLLAIAALMIFGGDNLWGFSLALFIGVLAGTYSSIYIANVVLIWLNLNSEDLIPPAATGKEVDDRP
jgi:preprotein translocase subunit SecF